MTSDPGCRASDQLKKHFAIGDRVVVSKAGGWQGDALATVVGGPAPVATRQGDDHDYWVEFDVPLRDLDGEGPYGQAQILSRHLRRHLSVV